jgi:hypothetical protein
MRSECANASRRERERERGVDRSAQSQGRSNNGEQQKGV